MTPSTSLTRMRAASNLCKRGAKIIAAAGLTVIIILAIVFFNLITENQANQGPHLNELFVTFVLALLMLIPIFFFFLILTAVSTLLDYMSGELSRAESDIQEVNDDRVEITPLPKMR